MIKGLIFDLDGVLVDTAKYHFIAWRKMANALGIDFTEEENEQLKGVSRRGSIEKILGWGGLSLSEDEIQEWMIKKNEWYLELASHMGPEELLPGVLQALQTAKKTGYKIALGSASKNAKPILDSTGITPFFDAVVDGVVVTASKPDPEVFTKGAALLGLAPSECVVFEDSVAGVQAALNGGMKAVGVGSPAVLRGAHIYITGFKDLDINRDILDTL